MYTQYAPHYMKDPKVFAEETLCRLYLFFSSAGIECALFCDHAPPPWMFGLES